MPQFRKKPVVIEATQWFKNGDHPLDYANSVDGYENGELRTFSASECRQKQWEGQLVRYYRNPDDSGDRHCEHCDHTMHDHGWIDTLEGGHIVCPGDWIITGVQGENYPCKPDIFNATYELLDEVRQHVADTYAAEACAADAAEEPKSSRKITSSVAELLRMNRLLFLTILTRRLLDEDKLDEIEVLWREFDAVSSESKNPDYIYEDTDPEGTTFTWDQRDQLVDIIEPEPNTVYSVKSVIEGPDMYFVRVLVDDDDPEYPVYEIQWFYSKQEAEAATAEVA